MVKLCPPDFIPRLEDRLVRISYHEYAAALSEYSTREASQRVVRKEDYIDGHRQRVIHRRGNYLYLATMGSRDLRIVYHKLDLTDMQVLVEIFKMKLKGDLPPPFKQLL